MYRKLFIFISVILFVYAKDFLEKSYKKEYDIEKLNEKNEQYLKKLTQKNKKLSNNKYDYKKINKKLDLIRRREAIQREKDKKEAEILLKNLANEKEKKYKKVKKWKR